MTSGHRFAVWAPYATRVEVETGGVRHPMHRAGPGASPGAGPGADTGGDTGGWWEADVANAGHGSDYAFRLDGSEALPDPRSAWQPHGVHGPSRVVDHGRFAWRDSGWPGRALAGGVVYELHVGTFSPEGTFDGAIARLDHLVSLGVDAVEVMPVAAFPGRHGWGYDGVALGAVHEPYGGPDGFKRFVDACHRQGLGVVLDVVYNHLGPSGNYLGRFGPYFTERHRTPWGEAVNLDGPGSDEVRRFVVDNALGWLRDYHVDGLRLDAVHAFSDSRATHLLEELAAEVDALAAAARRPLFVVAESDLNDPRLVRGREAGGYGLHAQWNDDFHHALHALLTGERVGYYADFGPLDALAKTLTRVFFHDGAYSSFRGRHHGRPVDIDRTPGYRFLGYLQNHDQIGNRAAGDRIGDAVAVGLLKVGAALMLTSPFTPMLFMGEEWGAGTPWQYFTDHPEPELAAAVREGRRHEFARFGWAPHDVPDPQDEATFLRSKLDWSEPERSPHRELLDWYRTLVALRRSRPELTDPRLPAVRVECDERRRWLVVHRRGLRVAVNLAAQPQPVPVPGVSGLLLASEQAARAGTGEVYLPGASVVVAQTG